ncbi:HNH endonuclease [Vibrio parahaemolyticus]|uniref:HNH endonuclease n=1 Tax=Vibrio parahaemolyticus TaxID=670 RepID=UPI00112338DA|nr:HNH endonuclease [Vibrio parahaemolyticus]EKA7417469.1 HNH endonuclease [Vibrio parahaemolyticus]ELA9330796.1 HNH endonuclease [Vibrio parahaemolyticus]TOM68589.1 HNH endonuclease [Vibrio parahaemolyticus]TOO84815.1 HNH endonuclease [Vibrio parahaemolyticus]HCG7131551.1 HNH endonuclease [Vibrio parahaemolyticus]
MIKISKIQKPKILKDNADTWAKELMGYVEKNDKIPKTLLNKYNDSTVKDALKTESSSKCMYCESVVKHVAHEHIEHIKPKSVKKYPSLTFEWNNLGLACPICNMNKSDTYDDQIPFINPYVDNPSDFFVAGGPYVFSKSGDRRAELTEKVIKLNRTELIEQRLERIDYLRELVDKYNKESNDTLKLMILNEIKIELESDKPYTFVSRAFVKIVDSALVI